MDAATPVIAAVSIAASPSTTATHHKALTPMISGIVSGGLVGLAWIIGFIIYFIKRHRREQRAIRLGYRGHREMLDPPKKKEAFIIPPDPAIVENGLIPGECIYDDGMPDEPTPKQSRAYSFTRLQKVDSRESVGSYSSMPPLPHRATAPSRTLSIKPPSPGKKGYDQVPMSPLSPHGRRGVSEVDLSRVTSR